MQKPLERGHGSHGLFFDGYVHDLAVLGDKTACLQSQSADEGSDDGVYVSFAICQRCPTGENDGLWQHFFALLIVIEHYHPSLPGPSSTSNPCKSRDNWNYIMVWLFHLAGTERLCRESECRQAVLEGSSSALLNFYRTRRRPISLSQGPSCHSPDPQHQHVAAEAAT